MDVNRTKPRVANTLLWTNSRDAVNQSARCYTRCYEGRPLNMLNKLVIIRQLTTTAKTMKTKTKK